ncbi:MAG: hypothetical protein K9L68_02385 [Spirochaetales bacterium]|nr:hypothetical protein [Spirochaetales bacterium]MCF7937424.1 hypothetical protein [Spirochaetales bacterium]
MYISYRKNQTGHAIDFISHVLRAGYYLEELYRPGSLTGKGKTMDRCNEAILEAKKLDPPAETEQFYSFLLAGFQAILLTLLDEPKMAKQAIRVFPQRHFKSHELGRPSLRPVLYHIPKIMGLALEHENEAFFQFLCRTCLVIEPMSFLENKIDMTLTDLIRSRKSPEFTAGWQFLLHHAEGLAPEFPVFREYVQGLRSSESDLLCLTV